MRSTIQLATSDLRRKKRYFDNLLGQISAPQDDLYEIKEKKMDLWECVKAYEGVIASQRFTAAETSLTGNVYHLKAERENLQSEMENQIKKAEEFAEPIVVNA